MATSTPTPPDTVARIRSRGSETLAPCASRSPRSTTLVALARHSIRVFDHDLSEMGWNSAGARGEARGVPARVADREARDHRARHALARASCPRLVALLQGVQRPRDDLQDRGPKRKGAADPLVIVDGRHFLHRFHVEQPRAALVIEDPHLARPLINRFEEIWATGEPGLTGTVLGI